MDGWYLLNRSDEESGPFHTRSWLSLASLNRQVIESRQSYRIQLVNVLENKFHKIDPTSNCKCASESFTICKVILDKIVFLLT